MSLAITYEKTQNFQNLSSSPPIKENDYMLYRKKIHEAAMKILKDQGKDWSNSCMDYLQLSFSKQSPYHEINGILMDALQAFSLQIIQLTVGEKKNLMGMNESVILNLLQVINPNLLSPKEALRLVGIHKKLTIRNDSLLNFLGIKIFNVPKHTFPELMAIIENYSDYVFIFPWIFDRVAEIALSHIDNVDSQNLTAILESLTLKNYFNPRLYCITAEKIPQKIEEFSLSELITLLLCFAQFIFYNPSMMRLFNRSVFELMGNHIFLQVEKLKANEIITIIWSLNTLDILCNDLALLNVLISKVKQWGNSFTDDQLTNLIMIFVKVNIGDLSLLTSLAEVVRVKIKQIFPINLINILNSFAYFFNINPHLRQSFNMSIFEEYTKEILHDFDRFNPEELRMLDASFNELKVYDPLFYLILKKVQQTKIHPSR